MQKLRPYLRRPLPPRPLSAWRRWRRAAGGIVCV